jgi:hypothetical protein
VGNIDLDSSGRGEMKRQASNIVWFLVNPLSFHTTVSLPASTQLTGFKVPSLGWRSTAPKWIRRQFISLSPLQQTNAAPFQTQKILSLMWMDARDGWMDDDPNFI